MSDALVRRGGAQGFLRGGAWASAAAAGLLRRGLGFGRAGPEGGLTEGGRRRRGGEMAVQAAALRGIGGRGAGGVKG